MTERERERERDKGEGQGRGSGRGRGTRDKGWKNARIKVKVEWLRDVGYLVDNMRPASSTHGRVWLRICKIARQAEGLDHH